MLTFFSPTGSVARDEPIPVLRRTTLFSAERKRIFKYK